jgi:hypothetical protein
VVTLLPEYLRIPDTNAWTNSTRASTITENLMALERPLAVPGLIITEASCDSSAVLQIIGSSDDDDVDALSAAGLLILGIQMSGNEERLDNC